MLQVQAQSSQGQHGQIPLAHPATAARHGPAELELEGLGRLVQHAVQILTLHKVWEASTLDANPAEHRHLRGAGSCDAARRKPTPLGTVHAWVAH